MSLYVNVPVFVRFFFTIHVLFNGTVFFSTCADLNVCLKFNYPYPHHSDATFANFRLWDYRIVPRWHQTAPSSAPSTVVAIKM